MAMPEPLVYLMLFLALVLPVIGAVGLRLSAKRLGERNALIAAAAIFAVVIASVLALSRSDVEAIRIGDVSLLLPGTHPESSFVLPADIPLEGAPEGAPVGPPVLPTLTPRPSATPTVTLTPEPSATPTATPEPPTATPSRRRPRPSRLLARAPVRCRAATAAQDRRAVRRQRRCHPPGQ